MNLQKDSRERILCWQITHFKSQRIPTTILLKNKTQGNVFLFFSRKTCNTFFHEITFAFVVHNSCGEIKQSVCMKNFTCECDSRKKQVINDDVYES